MRSRIALIAALAVALAVLLVAVSADIAVRHDLLGGVDRSLAQTATRLARQRAQHGLAGALDELFHPASSPSSGPAGQLVTATGSVVARTRGTPALPVTRRVRQAAAGRQAAYRTDATIQATPMRLQVDPFGHGLALELATPMGGVDAELSRLAAVLALAATAGVLLAGALGAAVAGVALRPVRRLTLVAEEVALTQDLSRRVPLEGSDELSRLAASLNTVLAALQRSQQAQRQLVADASHELRTPLASLRTNVELLAGTSGLDPEVRPQLVDDVTRQVARLGTLVGDLIELARQDGTTPLAPAMAAVDLDEVVGQVLDDQRRHHPSVRIEGNLGAARIQGVAADLERMVGNLVDNAAKWSPVNGRVEVHLGTDPGDRQVRLSVADEGPGIDPADLPHVFDRFFRGRAGMRVPGSGLGLAIVRRIAEVHGGTVKIDSSPGKGTRVEVGLPVIGSPTGDGTAGGRARSGRGADGRGGVRGGPPMTPRPLVRRKVQDARGAGAAREVEGR